MEVIDVNYLGRYVGAVSFDSAYGHGAGAS